MGKINWQILTNLYHTVQHIPGITKNDLAHAINVSPNAIESRLATLEKHGVLLYEDDYGHLYIAQKKESLLP